MGYIPLLRGYCAHERSGGVVYCAVMSIDYRKAIQDGLSAKGLTMKAASLAAGLGESYLRDVLNRGRAPSFDKFRKIANVLDLDPNILLSYGKDDASDVDATDSTRKKSIKGSKVVNAKIDKEIFKQIVVAIAKTRAERNIAVGGRTPESYADFVADVYNLCVEAGGDVGAVSHFLEISLADATEENE